MKEPSAMKRMFRHETCYLNYKIDVERRARLPCDRANLRYNSSRIRPYGHCVKGHSRTLLDAPDSSGVHVFCLVKKRAPSEKKTVPKKKQSEVVG